VSNKGLVDRAGAIREGEELDLDNLREHLRSVSRQCGRQTGNKTIFRAVHSNLTYLLQSGAESWVLRRPPFWQQSEISS
jgi:aminoglycoside phosphotransferase (APT) family kinase protein